MGKCIAVTVVPAYKLHMAQYLMESVKKTMPESDRCIIVLDKLPKDIEEWNLPFLVVQANIFWPNDYEERAFFYEEKEFTQVVEIKAVSFFGSKYEKCLLIKPEIVFNKAYQEIEQIFPDNIFLIKSKPVYEKSLPIKYFSYADINFNIFGIRAFGYGKKAARFLNWADSEIEYLYRNNISKDEFYLRWASYGILFGCEEINANMNYSAFPYDEVNARDVVFYDFSVSPTNKKTNENEAVLELYDIWVKKTNTNNHRYEYDFFSDGTPIFSLLRGYYLHNYRLRTACENNPFNNIEKFTESSMIIGEKNTLPLTGVMDAIYFKRPDVQKAFPKGRFSDRVTFAHWFLDHGIKEYKLHSIYFSNVKVLLKQQMDEEISLSQKQSKFVYRLKNRLQITTGEKKRPYPSGINLTGFIRGDFGIGEACRGLADIIDSQNIPMTIIETSNRNVHTYSDNRWNSRITNTFPYNVNLMYTNAQELDGFMKETGTEAFDDKYNIGYWAWEVPEFPEKWCHLFNKIDEVWTLSEFTAEAIRKKTSLPVFTLPPPVVISEIDRTVTRKDFDLPENKFVFLMMYDVNSIAERKNPKGALLAFQKAFEGRDDAILILKVNMPVGSGTKEDRAFVEEAKKIPNVRVFVDSVTRGKINALINMIDVYVSLHRCEGFGLGPAEAMYLGKPAIVTGWSGNMEYTNSEVCYPVKYKLIKIDKDYASYKKGMTWAEPDIEDAAIAMKRLADDKDFYNLLSKNGAKFIRKNFSPEQLGKKAKSRLQELGLL